MTKYQQGMAEYIAWILEDCLNEMNGVIGDEKETLQLLEEPERIEKMELSSFKVLSQVAYTYYTLMRLIDYRLEYRNGKIRVILNPFNAMEFIKELQ